jgi:hypothetical protein
MQLDGVQIDPKEWWDPHWIQDHVVRRIDAGLAPNAEATPTPQVKQGRAAKARHHR